MRTHAHTHNFTQEWCRDIFYIVHMIKHMHDFMKMNRHKHIRTYVLVLRFSCKEKRKKKKNEIIKNLFDKNCKSFVWAKRKENPCSLLVLWVWAIGQTKGTRASMIIWHLTFNTQFKFLFLAYLPFCSINIYNTYVFLLFHVSIFFFA